MEPWLAVLRKRYGKNLCPLDRGVWQDLVGLSLYYFKNTCLPTSTLIIAFFQVEELQAWLCKSWLKWTWPYVYIFTITYTNFSRMNILLCLECKLSLLGIWFKNWYTSEVKDCTSPSLLFKVLTQSHFD
jgi:uncharacterized ion transporter superfamily protein YfcC